MSFTVEDVANKVRALAAERPDFIYTSQINECAVDGSTCGYAGDHAGSTEGDGCIVGQALSSLGVSSKRLLEMDGHPASGVVFYFSKDPISQYNKIFSYWLDVVQNHQDGGKSWGEAVTEADRVVA